MPVQTRHVTSPSTVTTHTTPSLIFGTNLALFDTTDQVLNNSAAQQLLKQANVPIIRMPFRSLQGDASEIKALRAIQYIGAIPLVIVQGPTDPSALAHDRQLIALVGGIFGSSTVYVEFGNEPDVAHVDVRSYIAAWNAVIPALKAMAPTYRFVGPAASFPNPTYIASISKLANPRPDAISWHEYACHGQDPDEYCMTHLADWTAHIRSVNQAVRAASGTTIPIMITEWNLDDRLNARSENSTFMRAWTARALQTLAANQADGVMAAMQYCATNNGQFNLIDANNSLTPQGQTFFQALTSSVPAP